MTKEYYKDDIRYDKNGVMKSILKPIYEIPTLEDVLKVSRGQI